MDWILDYLYRTPASIRVGSESFSAVAETKLDLNFVFAEKTFLVVCLTSVFVEANRNRIACVMLVPGLERFRKCCKTGLDPVSSEIFDLERAE